MRAGAVMLLAAAAWAAELPGNRWVELSRDAVGARRGSAVRYASGARAFFLWGYMNADPELLQEQPLMRIPEYDVVAFDPEDGRWRNHFPKPWEELWSRRLPLAYVPRTYAGITTGSERTVLRVNTDEEPAAPRPDLNIVFDQVAYRPADSSLYYFTGGLTAAYDTLRRRWRDVEPQHSPPPVLGGSLAWDPVHDGMVLFGGGYVAERGPDGKLRGNTGTWIYSIRERDWKMLSLDLEPPPRMNTRLVCDRRNEVLVLFGGDGQTEYLADTWLFDLRARRWRKSEAPGGPAARAGHFTVWDPRTGLVIIGGGYNSADLDDMWGYDAARDRWRKLVGQVPKGFYLTGDIAPERRLILVVTNTRRPGDSMSCNILYPVRTTYGYRIDEQGLFASAAEVAASGPIPKRAPEELAGTEPDETRRRLQARRLETIPENQWVLLDNPGRAAPTRTWGSATFDPDRGQILYWGGGHCGYGGSDVDAYRIAEHTWIGDRAPDFPHRAWDRGVRLAGVTFTGRPWTTHGRKVYAYDTAGKRMISVNPIRLTTGYEPPWLRDYPAIEETASDAVVTTPSSYRKAVTWSYDPDSREWTLLGPAPAGVDTLLSTPRGVVGMRANWRGRLNDAGYQRPWRPWHAPEDNALYLLRGAEWQRLDRGGPSPQNLYEQTSLAYDSTRDRILLHGGGQRRDELWAFDWKSGEWRNLRPRVAAPGGAEPPICGREAVYLPDEDVMLAFARDPERGEWDTWVYTPADNGWRRVQIPVSAGEELFREAAHNRGMVYDAGRGLVFLVLGGRGDTGRASVFALRYRHRAARFVR